MGAQQSTVGLKMMEVIYPVKNTQSVFATNQKLKTALEKEVKKRGLSLDDLEANEEAVDGDLDSDIDRCVNKVFENYDRKGAGVLPKKIAEQFFNDCLELYAMRKGQKVKDILPKNVKKEKAIASAVAKMNTSGTGNITKQEFVQFLNCYDIDEALSDFFGTDGVDVDTSVQYVDVSQFANAKREGPKLVYRDYPDD
eukprot:TRINITY_DN10486_c0_g1_i1.p1 TRINITY_DN10486_c0_g1~~TRINITY_DN10486_c0_g1_i1.p1  ORF type:complete len:197 (-),score=64.23 TRINITY_DN10486_c0_g1_i1:153-743(-)